MRTESAANADADVAKAGDATVGDVKAGTSSFAEDPVVDRGTDEPALIVDVEGFEGPLDLLLMLARQQKVDLAKISILALADQYLAFIEQARAHAARARRRLSRDGGVARLSQVAHAAARAGGARRA